MSEAVRHGVFREFRWFEDFAVGQRFRYGAWAMQRDEMLAFARLYDPEPFHVDEAAARFLGWGGLIASGPQVAAIWRRLSKDAFPKVATVISPGWDLIRWLRPVRVGDVLSAASEVTACRPLSSRAGEGLVKMASDVVNQHDETVMHNIANWFVRCRPED
ncbi:MAG TPA: MaoC/PaaZ C-terminal domain-containing protein [Alphaproteobacteria bacterium]|nr:MaoC/PaaZ C-terminal domain-containing protein [Alphaproteobacteria bacterium]